MNSLKKFLVAFVLLTTFSLSNYTLVFGSNSTYQYGVWKTWTPTLVGWSSNPATGSYKYYVIGNTCCINVYQAGAATSNSTSTTLTLPVASIAGLPPYVAVQFVDNGTTSTTPGMATFNSTTVVGVTKDWNGATWTNSGTKLVRFNLCYQYK